MTAGRRSAGGPMDRHATLSGHVAAVLRRRIVRGDIPDGDTLPRQEDLQAEFGVSHPTVRESLRMLEAEGLVTVRRGMHGGAVVHSPKAQSAAFGLGLILEAEHTRLDDLARAMTIIEPEAAALCATRSDRDTVLVPELQSIQASNEAALDDPMAFSERSRAFHDVIARECGNSTLRLLLGTLESLWTLQMLEWTSQAVQRDEFATLPQRRLALQHHHRLLEAIAAGDPSTAREVARTHLDETVAFWLPEPETPLVEVSTHDPIAFATHGRTAPTT